MTYILLNLVPRLAQSFLVPLVLPGVVLFDAFGQFGLEEALDLITVDERQDTGYNLQYENHYHQKEILKIKQKNV